MVAALQTPQSYRSPYLWLDRERGRFLVHRSAYTSPDVFEEEKRRILRRSWIVLGHESEVRNKGDFIVRAVIDRELIFNRDVDGNVNAFFNSCRHRGAAICREPRGNRKRFVCPYHGWAYKSSGELFDQHATFGYGDRFNEGGFYDLQRVPRIGQRAGFSSSILTPARFRSTNTSRMRGRTWMRSPTSPRSAWKSSAAATSTRSRRTTS